MSKDGVILLSKILMSPDGKNVNKSCMEIIQEENIPVLCLKKGENKKRLMPFKVLYDNNHSFWQQAGSWEYYLTTEDIQLIKDKSVTKPGAWVNWQPGSSEKPAAAAPAPKPAAVPAAPAATEDEELEELEVEIGYGAEYKTFAQMSTSEKVNVLNVNKMRLNNLIATKNKDPTTLTTALVDTTKDAALINHAALEDALRMADSEAKLVTQELVNSTHEMIKSSATLVAENIFSNELVNTLVEKSNGTIVQHMTRVYLNGIAFLSFYNDLVSTSSAIQKLRISFSSKYRAFYSSLLPHLDPDSLNLERVFYGGMRAIPPDLYFKWAVGFLVHDIGKANAVEYHEGEAKYDRLIVIDHVKQGFKSIMNKTNYPREASLITGYHHEYYGDSAGYGYFRAYLHEYKKQNPGAKLDYCITYDLAPILDYHVLAYFPAKVLEIIDVYDSVTDPHRVYRKAMTPEEALTMMHEEFIVKHHKLDAILFDIFAMFIREQEKQKANKARV